MELTSQNSDITWKGPPTQAKGSRLYSSLIDHIACRSLARRRMRSYQSEMKLARIAPMATVAGVRGRRRAQNHEDRPGTRASAATPVLM